MHTDQQKALLWIGIVGIVVTIIGLAGFARFIPIPGPYLTPQEVAEIYQSRTTGIRFGSALLMLGGATTAFLMAMVGSQIKNNANLPKSLGDSVIVIAGANVAFNILPGIFFAVTAFRPERPIEITAALNDVSWFFAVMNAASFIIIQIPIALACFLDNASPPRFPRWLGYVNLWTALIYVPAFGVLFFKMGPFAWSGLLAFYVAAGAFLAWQACMYVILFKALNRERDELAQGKR